MIMIVDGECDYDENEAGQDRLVATVYLLLVADA
jgi:hypothetical protein